MASYSTKTRIKLTTANLQAVGAVLGDLMTLTGENLWLTVDWDNTNSVVAPADLFAFFGSRVGSNSDVNISVSDRD